MIDATVLYTAENLKKTMDAAYVVFRKRPTTDNATLWTTASRNYTDFCVKTITDLFSEEAENKQQEILKNIDAYKVCNKCSKELVYGVGSKDFVASIDFVEDFPGWCYDCLLDHCLSCKCGDCTVATRPSECSFVTIKNLHEQTK